MVTEEDCRNQFSTFLFEEIGLFSERLSEVSADADSSTTSSRGFPLGGREEIWPPWGGGLRVNFLEEGVGILEEPPEVGEGLLAARTAIEEGGGGEIVFVVNKTYSVKTLLYKVQYIVLLKCKIEWVEL